MQEHNYMTGLFAAGYGLFLTWLMELGWMGFTVSIVVGALAVIQDYIFDNCRRDGKAPWEEDEKYLRGDD